MRKGEIAARKNRKNQRPSLTSTSQENVRKEVSDMLQAIAKLVTNPLMLMIIVSNILKAKAK